MNAPKITILLAFTFLLIFSVVSRMFFNDFQNGWDAYVKKDYKTARELWFPLAEQRDTKAQFFLGFMHDLGFGSPEDDQEAIKWYQLAAEQGDSRAQLFAGFMYDFGQGVPQDGNEAFKWYRLAADQGYAEAKANIYNLAKRNVPQALQVLIGDAENGVAELQYTLGLMYANGEGVPQDDQKAVKWYRLAAEQGHAGAKANIYSLAKKSVPDALKILINDAENGSAEAQINLAMMHQIGLGLPQDDQEAIKWYRFVAEDELAQAQKNIISLAKKNVPQALKALSNNAENGVVKAQIDLGMMYGFGLVVPKDDRKAAKWYRLAAEQGNSRAQFIMGLMSASGQGVTQDDREAMQWYRLATKPRVTSEKTGIYNLAKNNVPQALKILTDDAENGVVAAQNILAEMYQFGLVVPKDDKKAAKWYRLAAEQGDSEARSIMGLIYANGQGVAQDDREALQWYRLAAEQRVASRKIEIYNRAKNYDPSAMKVLIGDAENGVVEAQYYLGAMYANGQGVSQDHKESAKWYRFAAEQEDSRAQYYLGVMYANGQGVPRDYVLAHMWYNLSGLQGHKAATDQINLVEQKMSPEQIEKAQEMVRDWKLKK